MAARPYWKGQIRLALVSIPVEIYTATKSGANIAFNPNWGLNGDVKFNGDVTEWFIGPRFTW